MRTLASADITCRYDFSFEMRLSASKYPPGSDSCSICAAKAPDFPRWPAAGAEILTMRHSARRAARGRDGARRECDIGQIIGGPSAQKHAPRPRSSGRALDQHAIEVVRDARAD